MTATTPPLRRWSAPCAGKIALVPSVLSADFSRLARDIKRVEAGADWIQVDVMDGHFVPNLSFGPAAARAISVSTALPVDAHLMVEAPLKFVDAFARAGARLITVHAEAHDSLLCVKRIKRLGLAAGVALRPGTPVSQALAFMKAVDLLLIMTVEPGFGGQEFLPSSPAKISRAREMIRASGRGIWLQADGGINRRTAGLAVRAGADSLVMGSAVFGAPCPAKFLKELRQKLGTLQAGNHHDEKNPNS